MRRGTIFGIVILFLLAAVAGVTGCKEKADDAGEVKAQETQDQDVKAEPKADSKPVPIADLSPLEVVEDIAGPAEVVSQLDGSNEDQPAATDTTTDTAQDSQEADALKLPDLSTSESRGAWA
jgi:hypothetical protein